MSDKPLIDKQTNDYYVDMPERAGRKSWGEIPEHAPEFVAESKRRSRRRRTLSSKVKKLKEVRVDRGSSPNEAAFAHEKRRELEAELATIPAPARFLPQHMLRPPFKTRPNPTTGAKPTLYLDVTERALTQRINRALPRDQKLRIARGKTAETRGEFYLMRRGAILDPDVDIEVLGRKLRVLKPYERLVYPPRIIKGPIRVGEDPCLAGYIPEGNDSRRRNEKK
jgi:hypothetical protein